MVYLLAEFHYTCIKKLFFSMLFKDRMLQLIRFFDFGGVTYKFRIDKQESEHKSLFGGAVSIIIYTLSLIYATYIVQLWVTN